MARIRSDKPESYQSETLAEISLAAERTFRGMATIADDRGRLADKPAQINGELWSMRSEREPHTRDDLEAELAEMVKVDSRLPLHRLRREALRPPRQVGFTPEDRPAE